MCGIHGLINLDTTYFSDGSKFIHDGFVAGSLRGMDSSGIFQLDKQFKPFMTKAAKSGPQFIKETDVKAFLTDAARSPLTVCHVRAATVGSVKADNAHPFCVSDETGKRLIGVHNGTLYNWERKEGAKDINVDSHWAMKNISTNGIDAFKDFQGAYCFAWWDEHNPSKFQMIRNSQRPMHFMLSKDKKKMIFGSEAMMVAWIAERNRILVEPEVYALEEGKLYTFALDAKEISFTKGADDLSRFSSAYNTTQNRSNHYSNMDAWNDYEETYGFGYRGYGMANTGDPDGVSHTGLTFISGLAMELDNAALELDERKEQIAAIVSNEDDTEASTTLELVPKQLPAVVNHNTHTVNNKPAELMGGDLSDAAILPAKCYSPSTASQAERNAAKSLGVYGELQWLQGVMFEPELCTVLGFIEDYSPGEGRVSYDAELRCTTAAIADRKYINNKSIYDKPGDWVVIIGATTDKDTNKRLFVVAPLNDEGRRHIMKRAN